MSDHLVGLDRLEYLVGSVSGASQQRANELLLQASNMVREFGDSTWTADTVPGRAADIALQATYRVYTNPDGAAQKSVGDVSVSYSRTGLQGSAVYLTKDEKRALRRLAGRGTSTITLVSPYSGDEEVES
jgi:hypothetical protein